MRTDDLIATLAAEAGAPPAARPDRALAIAITAGMALSLALFLATLGGPRPDFAASLSSPRFLLKFAVTLSVAAAGLVLVPRLVRPGARLGAATVAALLPLAVVAGSVAFEVASLPGQALMPALVGEDALVCLVFVPLLGAAPLAGIILALRHGAPTRPTLAGAVAGILAGGLAATLYASHCIDDSPLFVATWYTLGIAVLAAAGALAGRRWLRW